MRAWLYLLAAGVAGGIVIGPALFVLFLIPGQTFDDALLNLYRSGEISMEEALSTADSSPNLQAKIAFGG